MLHFGSVVERTNPLSGGVEELITYDEAAGLYVPLQAAYRTGADDAGGPELPHRPYVRPVGDLGRRVLVLLPVTGQEGNFDTVDRSSHDRCRRRPVGGGHFSAAGIVEELVETRSAEHTDHLPHPLNHLTGTISLQL